MDLTNNRKRPHSPAPTPATFAAAAAALAAASAASASAASPDNNNNNSNKVSQEHHQPHPQPTMDGRKELAIVLPPTSHDLSPSIPEQHHPAFAALPPAPSSAAVGILPLPPPPPSTLPTSPSRTISPQQLELQHHQQQQQQQSGHHPAALVAAGTSPAQPSPLPQPSQMASFVQSSLHWVYNISTPETFDSNGLPRNRRKRRRTTDEEHAALEAAYRLDPQMPPAEREKLARTLNMPSKSVQIWFQNRRQTAKKNQDGTWNGIGNPGRDQTLSLPGRTASGRREGRGFKGAGIAGGFRCKGHHYTSKSRKGKRACPEAISSAKESYTNYTNVRFG
ncbi:hypothetical protein DFJ77DRAFT_210789 [Powellomyces hirtus]|nr:hypothetical protein DFJ77DRAFT_210789 [Powellomyces hirtus]